MTFPNAVAGLKLCIIGEVIDLFTAVCIAAVTIISGTVMQDVNLVKSETNLIFTGGAILLIALTLAFMGLAALVVKFVGAFKAAKDEYSFRGAAYGLILGMLTTVVGVLFADNTLISGAASVFTEIADMFAMCMVVQGIRHLAIFLRNDDIERRGSIVIKLIMLLYTITTIFRMILILMNQQGMFYTVSNVIIVVINAVVFVMYISYLVRSRRFIKNEPGTELEGDI